MFYCTNLTATLWFSLILLCVLRVLRKTLNDQAVGRIVVVTASLKNLS